MIAVFSFMQLIFLFIFALLFIWGVGMDRAGVSSTKWYIFIVAVLFLVFSFARSDITMASIWADMKTFDFWKPLLGYMAIGLAYSLIEFGFTVKRAKGFFSRAWASVLPSKGFVDMTEDEIYTAKSQIADKFVSQQKTRYSVITVTKDQDGYDIRPQINLSPLVDHVTVWTIFWPFYMVSLAFQDVFTEIFKLFGSVIKTLTTKLVSMTFKNIFKF